MGAAAAGGLVLLYLRHPSYYPIPQCPFYALTGWYCPGCGTLRGLHFLLHGQLATAFRFNPLAILLLPYIGIACGRQALALLGPSRSTGPAVSRTIERLLVATILAFVVVRNLPFGAFDMLRPGGG